MQQQQKKKLRRKEKKWKKAYKAHHHLIAKIFAFFEADTRTRTVSSKRREHNSFLCYLFFLR
jgi:hypothetical protein